MKHLSRRGFLKVAGVSALALTASCKTAPPTVPSSPTATPVAPIPTTVVPLPTVTDNPTAVPAKAIAVDRASLPAGIDLTPTEELYRQSYGTTPSVDAKS